MAIGSHATDSEWSNDMLADVSIQSDRASAHLLHTLWGFDSVEYITARKVHGLEKECGASTMPTATAQLRPGHSTGKGSAYAEAKVSSHKNCMPI